MHKQFTFDDILLPVEEPHWLTTAEAAKQLRAAPTSICRWIADGRLQGEKVGGVWRVSESSVTSFHRKRNWRNDSERFFSLIVKDETTGCWLWSGPTDIKGYGSFWYENFRWHAHRLSYTLHVRELALEEHLHHSCETKNCVCPDHLVVTSRQEHQVRYHPNNPVVNHAQRTHCPKGHPLVEGNLVPWHWKNGQRACLTCKREDDREYSRRNREKVNAWKRNARAKKKAEAANHLQPAAPAMYHPIFGAGE